MPVQHPLAAQHVQANHAFVPMVRFQVALPTKAVHQAAACRGAVVLTAAQAPLHGWLQACLVVLAVQAKHVAAQAQPFQVRTPMQAVVWVRVQAVHFHGVGLLLIMPA